MNAKRKRWDFKTILLGLLIAVILIAVIFVVFAPSSKKSATQTALSVSEVWQNRESYIGKNITVEGFYYESSEGPCLVPATSVSNPNPDIKINLDRTSLNSAKQAAGNITVTPNLKYHVEGVLEKVPIVSDFKIIVKTIKAV